MVSKFVERKIKENVWEHENIGKFWKEKREQGPPLGDPQYVDISIKMFLFFLFFSPLNYINYAFAFKFLLPLVECYIIFRHEKFC